MMALGIIGWIVLCTVVFCLGWLAQDANVEKGAEIACVAGLFFAALEGWIPS